jgi:hypothetical protein
MEQNSHSFNHERINTVKNKVESMSKLVQDKSNLGNLVYLNYFVFTLCLEISYMIHI